MNEPRKKPDGNGVSRLKKALLMLTGLALGVLFSLPYFLLREEISRVPALGYAGILAGCAISNGSLFLPTSSTLIVLAASATLNPLLCVLAGGIGAGLGEQVSYFCGRVGLSWIERDREIENGALLWLKKNSLLTVFLTALLPLPLPVFDFVGLCAGAIKMNWVGCTAATVAGKVLKFIAFVGYLRYVLPLVLGQMPEWVQKLYESFV